LYKAERIVKIQNGFIITSIINTTAEEVQLSDHVVKVEEIDDRNTSEAVFLRIVSRETKGVTRVGAEEKE